jgi:hypothetical protein
MPNQQLFSIVIVCEYAPEGAPPGMPRPKYIPLLAPAGTSMFVLYANTESLLAKQQRKRRLSAMAHQENRGKRQESFPLKKLLQ